jgi:hypothetical protein
MNRPLKIRDKRIAMLLIAAFAWLFIGSLVIFHEEHVLGKHFSLISQAFISPKSNDKQGFSIKLQNPLQKLYEDGGTAGIFIQNNHSRFNNCAFEIKPRETSSFYQDKEILNYFPLRAPPSV